MIMESSKCCRSQQLAYDLAMAMAQSYNWTNGCGLVYNLKHRLKLQMWGAI